MPERFVFELEWLAPAAVLIAGAIAGFAANRAARGKAALLIWTLTLLLAAGVAASTRAVTTDREAVAQRSRDFFDAVIAGDRDAAAPLLSERLALTAGDDLVPGYSRPLFLAFVPTVPNYVNEAMRSVRAVETEGNRATSDIFVRVLGGAGTGTYELTLRWTEEPAPAPDADAEPDTAWRITKIEVREVNNEPVRREWVQRWL